MEIKPCKHLDYENDYHNCELKTHPDYPEVKYWYRTKEESGNPVRVQFCKKNYARINGIFDCYVDDEMPCYEPE